MSKLEVKNGDIMRLDINAFYNNKNIDEFSPKSIEIRIGEEKIVNGFDQEIIKSGLLKKYNFHLDLSSINPDYKKVKFEVVNKSFNHIKKLREQELKAQLIKNNLDAQKELILLKQKFNALENINETLKDKVRNLTNELNEGKRITVPQEEIDKIKLYALQKFFEDFSNPYSTFKLAVESGAQSSDQSVKTYVGGFTMLLNMLESVFTKHGLVIEKPNIGDDFDPKTQKAIDFVIDNNAEPGKIAKINSDAYLLNGRVIKYALVVLTKKGE